MMSDLMTVILVVVSSLALVLGPIGIIQWCSTHLPPRYGRPVGYGSRHPRVGDLVRMPDNDEYGIMEVKGLYYGDFWIMEVECKDGKKRLFYGANFNRMVLHQGNPLMETQG